MGKSYKPRALTAFRSGPTVVLDGRHKERFEKRESHYEMGILYILANDCVQVQSYPFST